MPEVTIDEDSKSGGWKHEVWATRDATYVLPEAVSELMEARPKLAFWKRVATPDRSHDPAALLGSQVVHLAILGAPVRPVRGAVRA